MSEDLGSFAREIREVLEQLIGALPSGAAELELSRTSGGDPIVRIVPANPNAAPVSAHIVEQVQLVDLTLGEACTFELPSDFPQHTGETTASLVTMLARAAIAGEVQEEISQGLTSWGWKARIKIKNQWHRYGSRHFLHVGRPHKRTRTYEPYHATPSHA